MMGMSDCVKCWDTPCRCGHNYKDWSEKDLEEQIAMLQKVLEEKRTAKPKPTPEADINDVQSHPNAKFVGEFQSMVMQRINRKTVGLYPAQVISGGYLIQDKIDDSPVGDDPTAVLLIGVNKYRIKLTDPLYPKLTANVGQSYAIIKHHTMHYLVPTVTAGGHGDILFMTYPNDGKPMSP